MRTEGEVREKIKEITTAYHDVLDCRLATVQTNAPRALMQLDAVTKLGSLYWVLSEERPKFRCDD